MLQLDISPFQTGTHTFTLNPTAEMLELDPEQFSDIRVEVRLDYRSRKRAFIIIRAYAQAHLICDRTSVLFSQPIEDQHAVLFTHQVDKEPVETSYEVRSLGQTEHFLDLTDIVRDTLILALPLRKVAPEAEDKDVQVQFGVPAQDDDEWIDPRWEALRKLKSDVSEL